VYPEDRVLVAVLNRRRDLRAAREDGWYRVPLSRLQQVTHSPHSIDCEYLAFFLSRAFGAENGAVRYVARCRGIELATRRDLLPAESDHPRADIVYFRVAIGPLQPCGPIVNADGHRISFIRTTWERLTTAATVADLYGQSDSFRG
jgi:hypothetical protein